MRGKVVVLGDFNATPFSRILAMIVHKSDLRRITSLPSWPTYAELPQLAIDHIFLSRDVRVLQQPRIGRPSGSDHYPLTAVIGVETSSISQLH
jgi:endonuclease/exonuclease/phosphatase (EEP) superfamily protein YafD